MVILPSPLFPPHLQMLRNRHPSFHRRNPKRHRLTTKRNSNQHDQYLQIEYPRGQNQATLGLTRIMTRTDEQAVNNPNDGQFQRSRDHSRCGKASVTRCLLRWRCRRHFGTDGRTDDFQIRAGLPKQGLNCLHVVTHPNSRDRPFSKRRHAFNGNRKTVISHALSQRD